MSEQELSLTHRLFALLERWVKETRVHGIEIVPDPNTGVVRSLDFKLDTGVGQLDYSFSTALSTLDFTIESETIEIVQSLILPRINDAAMQDLEAVINDETVDQLTDIAIYDQDTSIGADNLSPPGVHDLFKKFNLKPRLFYSTAIHKLDIKHWRTDLKVKSLPVTFSVKIQENLLLAKRFAVERKPAEVSYVSEKNQLILWKKAVEKSRKEPKDLKLIGIYPGVPFYFIQAEKISINPANRILTYRFKAKLPNTRSTEDLRDLALFSTIPQAAGSKPALIMVKK